MFIASLPPLSAEFSSSASYVDLLLNPERYTGYSGYSTNRIWSAIYTENCFVYVHACVCVFVCVHVGVTKSCA